MRTHAPLFSHPNGRSARCVTNELKGENSVGQIATDFPRVNKFSRWLTIPDGQFVLCQLSNLNNPSGFIMR